ncbi:hypothetical protein K438DRAFT_1581968 [Mycena galopus ATCC 62051]|nr:hypothetical protein K438DRAFT_1581968 [Mycena galopus ATCC 62051]
MATHRTETCTALDSDPAVKEILISMNEKDNFIIEDLDDYHLLIKADDEYRVRRELEIELEKNTYSLEA